jgi:hypothetical protein
MAIKNRTKCNACRKLISMRVDGSGPIAHKCPHGRQCVWPDWARTRVTPCEDCNAQAVERVLRGG